MIRPSMQAAVLNAHGQSPSVSRIPRPEPGPGEVLVRIAASGVNPLDAKIQQGQAAHARHPLPAILGIDLAGVVESVGVGVDRFRPGDAVYGMTGGVGGAPGSLAQFAAVDADLLALKPSTLTLREAAAVPLVFITAWEGLIDRARVQAGQRVLVQGGAGGVGRMAVQIARAFGARAYATASAGDHETLRRLGATPIDRREAVADYVGRHTDGLGFDLVYDCVGGAVLDASFEAVRRFGHVVSCLGWGSHALAPLSFKAATYSGVFTLIPLLTGEGRAHHGAILREATRLIEAGQVRPFVDPRTFGLETVMDAYQALQDRGGAGKLVIDIAG